MDYSIYQEINQLNQEHIDDQYALWLDDDTENTPQLTDLQQKAAMNFKENHPKLCANRTWDEIFTFYLGEF